MFRFTCSVGDTKVGAFDIRRRTPVVEAQTRMNRVSSRRTYALRSCPRAKMLVVYN